jgi:hypothetical protein
MSGPNRKMRRAAAAKARKAGGTPVPPDELIRGRVVQQMYDQEVLKRAQVEQALVQARAVIAALVLTAGDTEVLIEPETLQFLENEGVSRIDQDNTEEGVRVFVTLTEADDNRDEEE